MPQTGAVYCQLTQTAEKIEGECRVIVPEGASQNGLQSRQFSLIGQTDGRRAILREVGLFGLKSVWGTATLNGTGFVLERSSYRISQLQFKRVFAAEVNSVIAKVEEAGQERRVGFLKRQAILRANRETVNVRNGLRESHQRLEAIDSGLAVYVRDSVLAARNLAAARQYVILMQDSVNRFRNSGFIEARLDDAEIRVQDRNVSLEDASRRLLERRLARARIVQQINTYMSYLGIRH